MNAKRSLYLATAALLLCGAMASTAEETGDAESLGINAAAVIGAPDGAPLSGAALDEATDEVASVIRCPVCQGLSVADSRTLSAQAMKREVYELLAAGYSERQILEYFEQSYGEFIRLEPKPEGFNIVVWAAPILALIFGAFLVARRSRTTVAAAKKVAAEPADDDLEAYRDQVRQEIGS